MHRSSTCSIDTSYPTQSHLPCASGLKAGHAGCPGTTLNRRCRPAHLWMHCARGCNAAHAILLAGEGQWHRHAHTDSAGCLPHVCGSHWCPEADFSSTSALQLQKDMSRLFQKDTQERPSPGEGSQSAKRSCGQSRSDLWQIASRLELPRCTPPPAAPWSGGSAGQTNLLAHDGLLLSSKPIDSSWLDHCHGATLAKTFTSALFCMRSESADAQETCSRLGMLLTEPAYLG